MGDKTAKTIEQELLKALCAEHEGHHFYSMAASSTSDEKGKSIFLKLADDERRHAEFLKAQYDAFRTSGRPDAGVSLGPIPMYGGSSPIFSDAIRARIKKAHYEMTALSVGIMLELDAVKHYNRLAEESADDPTVFQFFKELAEWESEHYRILLAQQEELREEYWDANGFSPM